MEWKAINKEGRHVGLDFYDLLIEAIAQLCAFCSPFSGLMSALEILRTLTLAVVRFSERLFETTPAPNSYIPICESD
jgi:hypothetical protein